MQTFLEQTAKSIVNTEQYLKDVICVLPSERAGIYLKNCIIKELKGEISFLPKIISIEKFITEISGVETLDQVSLVFEFYKIYKEACKSSTPDTFEQFIGWATIALQDFNEIDRHLVSAKEIFKHLTDLQNIKDWSPVKDQETETIQNYMSFVRDLETYYVKLGDSLLNKNLGYQGMVYRNAFKKHKDYIVSNSNKSFHFVGFNALNKAEEYIFQSFLELDKNHIYWDIDEHYVQGTHEAGLFVRNFFEEWDCLQQVDKNLLYSQHFGKRKNIQILGAPSHVTGIKSATSLLSEQLNPEETALVLAEESMLSVVLNSLPTEVNKVNITMGYALHNIPLSGLFQSFFDLHLNKQKLGKDAFYYKDVLSFFRHPYITKATQGKNNVLIQKITKNNWVFLSSDRMVALCNEYQLPVSLLKLYIPYSSTEITLDNILDFINFLSEKLEGIELLYVEGYRKVFQAIVNLNTTYSYLNTLKVLYKIFKKLLPLETVDFKGEALEGLQLMGVLETRCLDFKNVILTSVNEGILPAGKSERSFISFEVKQFFNMPTYLAKDAVFSYHFYRLLQRAENIYLLYNTKTDDFGGGEMSRFLTQLLIAKEEETTHKYITAPVHSYVETAKEIKKTPKVMEVLQAYLSKGISPSRIIDYINDPLEFYEKMVLKIRETDKIEEEVAANTLGTVVHDSLELLYKPYLNKILKVTDLKTLKNQANAMVLSKFKEYFKEGDIHKGKNKLIYEVALQFVVNFLDKEHQDIVSGKEIVVKDLESEYHVPFVTAQGHKVMLKGKIDRVDEVDGVRRIVDYKTGRVEVSDLKLSDLSVVMSDYKYHKIVQVMTYVLMYTRTHQISLDDQIIQTGIYSFKNFKSGFLAMNFAEGRGKNYEVTTESVLAFEESLSALLDSIMDTELNFTQNVERKFKKEI